MNRSRLFFTLVPVALAAAAGTPEIDPAGNVRSAAELSVIAGRPTDRAITLSVLSARTLDARILHGVEGHGFDATTGVRRVEAGRPMEFELASLKPDSRYAYRLLGLAPGTAGAGLEAGGGFVTQRAPGATFTFGVQGDSHPEREGKMFDPQLYARTLRNVAAAAPDFHVMLGDDFSIEHLIARRALSQGAVDEVYARQRGFLGLAGLSCPLFLVNGNHEQAALCNLDGTPGNAAVLAGLARTRYFPLPAPDGFYMGNSEEVQGVGLPRDYAAWTWGDALFVVIDFYWHSRAVVDNRPGERGPEAGRKRDGGPPRDVWDATLGETQYRWLARTLGASRARWKFVFCHHVLGTGRGGVEVADLGEWGGSDRRGNAAFRERRPGWELPIHQLMVEHGVTILFQGHDHLFARQTLDGIVYQSCPNPADPTRQAFNREAYRSGDILPNSGYLNVTVSPEQVTVAYVRSWLPGEETADRRNGETAFQYSITGRTSEP